MTAQATEDAATVHARIVYWGIEGAGKSTNLQFIHGRLRPDHRGELQRIPTAIDPATHYEQLPIELGEISGFRTRLQISTVPTGPEQAPTRKQILDRVDGIVLVLDARRESTQENLTSLDELRAALSDYGMSLEQIPTVLQYNKRDLTDDMAVEELHRKIALHAAAFEAIATKGMGVLECLTTISKRVVRNRREISGSTLPPAPAPAREEPQAAPPPDLDSGPPTQPAVPPVPEEGPTDGRFGLEPTVPALVDSDVTMPSEPDTAPSGWDTLPSEPDAIPSDPEGSDSVARAIDTAAKRAERIFDANWDDATGGFDARTGSLAPLDLRIRQVGAATKIDDRKVRIELEVVDVDDREDQLTITFELGRPKDA